MTQWKKFNKLAALRYNEWLEASEWNLNCSFRRKFIVERPRCERKEEFEQPSSVFELTNRRRSLENVKVDFEPSTPCGRLSLDPSKLRLTFVPKLISIFKLNSHFLLLSS
jgi:hypothetical protein